MFKVNPYLNFNGNTEEAFNFYKSVFGGEFVALQRFRDTPEAGNIPADAQDKIMHIALMLGQDTMLMATDTLESMGQKLTVGTNFSISLNPDSEEEATSLYNALSVGGKIQVPLEKAFWGAYFGMFTDKFGIQWMINYDYPKTN